MAQLTADFDAGSDGSDILTSDPGSATAWDVRFTSGGGSMKYDNDHAHSGTLAGKWVYPGSSVNKAMEWTTALGTITDHYGRVYLYTSAYQDSSPDNSPICFRSGSTGLLSIRVQTDGKLSLEDAAFGNTSGTVPIALNQWVRIEWHIVHNASTGSAEVRLFNSPESGTPDETINWTNRNTGSSANRVDFGSTNTSSSTWAFWLDDIVVNAADWPGPASEYSSEVMADSPLGYWRLGESAGTTAEDSSGNNRDGTYTNTPTLGVTGLIAGDANTAVEFDGVDEWVNLTNNAAFQINSGTIEAWVSTSDNRSGFHAIIVKQLAFGLFLDTGVLVSYSWGGSSGTRSTGINIADGLTHHVALVFDSGVTDGSVIYLDGDPVLTTTIQISNNTVQLDLSDGNSSQRLEGTIDEAAIYGTMLSPAQIAAHYAAGAAAEGALAYWVTTL